MAAAANLDGDLNRDWKKINEQDGLLELPKIFIKLKMVLLLAD